MDHEFAIERAMKHEEDLEKLQALTELAHDCQSTLNRVRVLRSTIINDLLEDGVSRREISRQLGISHTAVNALAAAASGKGPGE